MYPRERVAVGISLRLIIRRGDDESVDRGRLIECVGVRVGRWGSNPEQHTILCDLSCPGE